MWERVGTFLFAVLMLLGSLGAAGWLVITGQAASVEGLFLVLVCLVLALVFAVTLVLLFRSGAESASPAPATSKATAAATAAAKAGQPAAGTAKTESHPAPASQA